MEKQDSPNKVAADYARQGETYRLMGIRVQVPSDPNVPFMKAINAFNEAIKLAPKYAWAYAHRGATYYFMGGMASGYETKQQYYNQAIDDFDQAIKYDKDYAWAYAQKGETYYWWGSDAIGGDEGMKYCQMAIPAFDEAIKLAPKYAWAYAHRGATYRLMGLLNGEGNSENQPNYDRALSDFSQALEYNKDYAWAYAYRGVVHRAKKQWQDACEDIEKAVQLYPGVFDLPNLRHGSNLYPPPHAVSEQVALADTILQEKPNDPFALYAIAASKARREGLAAAQAEIDRARAAGTV